MTLTETAGDRLSRLMLARLTDPLISLRNAESLRRLERIAETGVAKPNPLSTPRAQGTARAARAPRNGHPSPGRPSRMH